MRRTGPVAVLRTVVRGAPAALLVLLAAGCAAGPGGEWEVGEPADTAAAERAEEDLDARRAASDRLVQRGRGLLDEGRDAEAAGVLERAVRRDPSNGHAYLALARARISLGDEEAAVGLLERAAALLRDEDPAAAERADSLRASLEAPGAR